MTLETFFEKFDELAGAPNAVAKMRELVLHLAIQGRLVFNSPDNPVGAEQLASEKQRLLHELRVRSHPETPQATKEDFPFAIPRAWHAVSLGDLAYSCPTSYGADPAPSLVKAGVVKVGNINNRGGFKGQFSERGFLANEIDSLIARSGDLMVVKSSGSAENVHSGKTALCTSEHDGKIVGSNFVLRLRLLGIPAIPEYVWRVLTSRYSRAWVEGTVQTMTYPNLKWSDFARLPIPLPPLAEQKRIVAKVDELMALCDRLEAQQQEREARHASLVRASLARFAEAPTPANLDLLFHKSYSISPADLQKSILTLAVQGKLVPLDPSHELPQETLATRVAKHASPEGDRDAPFDLPNSWHWTQLGQVSELINGDRSKNYPNKAEYVREGVAWINTGHIEPDGRLSADSMHYITREKFDSLRSGKVRPGDLVYCLRGATLGKTAIITQFEEGAVASSLVIIRLSAGVDPKFAYRFLTSPLGREQIFQFDNGSAQPNLSANNVKKYWLPLPPLAEQRRIVAKVDELMALVDTLEAQLATARTTAGKLMEAVVAELTTQD